MSDPPDAREALIAQVVEWKLSGASDDFGVMWGVINAMSMDDMLEVLRRIQKRMTQ